MRLRFERSHNIRPKFHIWFGRGTYSSWIVLRLFGTIYELQLIYD